MSEPIGFCPHCGNTAPQRLILKHTYKTVGYSSDGTRDEDGPVSTYYAAACETCDDLLLYHSFCDEHGERNFPLGDLMYPKSPDLHPSVPNVVRSCFSEAAKIQNLAPNAYAVMIRRAMEAICDDRGIPKGTLSKRLEALAAKGDIPSTLAEMTSILRILGNAGAHDVSQSVTVPQTWSMDEFFRAVVEYVYVAPSKLAKFRAELKEREAKGA